MAGLRQRKQCRSDRLAAAKAAITVALRPLTPQERQALGPWLAATFPAFADFLRSKLQRQGDFFARVAQSAYTTFKERLNARNRRSHPDTVRRNIEMCDRRAADAKRWTLERLARTYAISRRAVQHILKRAGHWRALGASN
jgi:hypothetical protein